MAHSMTEAELHEIYTFALDLGRRAGKILLDGVEKRTGEQSGRDVGVMEEKMNAVDIVCTTFSCHCPILTIDSQVTQTDLGTLI
jgi:myo-inositol-1(or 4)-monophosphatase